MNESKWNSPSLVFMLLVALAVLGYGIVERSIYIIVLFGAFVVAGVVGVLNSKKRKGQG